MSRAHTDLVEGYLVLKLKINFAVFKHLGWLAVVGHRLLNNLVPTLGTRLGSQ